MDAAQRFDENGYEWFIAPDGTNFYRTIGSQTDWTTQLKLDFETSSRISVETKKEKFTAFRLCFSRFYL